MSVLSTRWTAYILVAVAAAAVFGGTLRFDFVTYDDQELVVENAPYLGRISNIPGSFATHVFTTHRSSSAYYRPLLLVSYIFDYHVWKLDPLGYHLTNLILHVLAALLLLRFVGILTPRRLGAVFAALLFALHPVQSESVAWVAGRNDILLGVFVMLMMLFYSSAHPGSCHEKRFFALSCVSFALALFTKESAAFYIALFPLYDLCIGRLAADGRGSLRRLAIPAGILIVYLGVRLSVIGSVIGAEGLYGGTPFIGRLAALPATIVEHCRLILLPFSLSVVHDLGSGIWIEFPWNVLAALAVLLLALALRFAWKKDHVVFFGLAWFTLGLLPTLNLIPLAVPLLEHRLYVPLAGIAIACGRLAGMLSLPPARGRIVNASFAFIIVAAGIVSFLRIPVWKDSESLWTDAIRKAPGVSRSYLNLAGFYFERSEYDRTIVLMKQYLVLEPDDFMGYSKLRQTYVLNRQYGEAAAVSRTLIAKSPRNPHRYIELAKFFEQLSMPDSAKALYLEAMAADSTSDEAALDLGVLSERLGDLSSAERYYRRATEIAPRHAYPSFALGGVLARLGRDSLAVRSIEEGIAKGEPPKETARLLLHLYEKTGRRDDARRLREKFGYLQ